MVGVTGGSERGQLAPPKVMHVLTQDGAAEAPQDHVVIHIVTGVLGRFILEKTVIYPQSRFHIVIYLPSPPGACYTRGFYLSIYMYSNSITGMKSKLFFIVPSSVFHYIVITFMTKLLLQEYNIYCQHSMLA